MLIFPQAHDSSVRTMVWSHNDQWMVTGDTGGFVKYWQTNMNNVKLFQAHKDPVRGLRYPHLCHRPLYIIIVTTIITPTTTHPCHPLLILWEPHRDYQRLSLRRCSCFPLVNFVFHSWRAGRIGRSFLLRTCFLVFMMCHKGLSSTAFTQYFTIKSKQFLKLLNTLYCILIWIHFRIFLENLKFLFFTLNYIYFFLLAFFGENYSNYNYNCIKFEHYGKFLIFL